MKCEVVYTKYVDVDKGELASYDSSDSVMGNVARINKVGFADTEYMLDLKNELYEEDVYGI